MYIYICINPYVYMYLLYCNAEEKTLFFIECYLNTAPFKIQN